MNDSKSELRKILTALKCMVFSSKEGMSVVALNKDYEQLYGIKIPFNELGFKSIDELLMKIPSVKLYEKDNTKYIKTDGGGISPQSISMRRDKLRSPGKSKPLDTPVRKPNIHKINLGKQKSIKTADEKKDNLQESPLTINSSANLTSPTSNSRGKLADRLIVKPTNDTRDANEPPTSTSPTKSSSDLLEQDPRVELANFTKKLNLPDPDYKNYETKAKDGSEAIYCSVSIGPRNKWNSYPQEATTNEEAEKLAATQALLALHKLHGPLVQLRVTSDKELIKQRIIAIVDVHSNGIIVEQLPAYYKDKHNETLPDNWIEIIKQCHNDLSIVKGVGEIWILEKATELNKQLNKNKTVETCAKSLNSLNLNPLVPPNDIHWPVYVASVISSTEVWAQIIGEEYSDKAHQISTELHRPGLEPKIPATNIQLNKYYVLKEQDECWHRVRVDRIDAVKGKVDVFFIDYGDFDTVDSKQLYPLDKRFYKIPAQAIKFSMFGLEELAEFENVTSIIEELIFRKRFYCKIILKKFLDNNLIVNGIFLDTTTGDDVNMNDLVLEKLGSTLLNNEGQIAEVVISQVNVNGDIYLHLKNNNLKILAELISKLQLKLITTKQDNNVNKNEIYLVQCPDGNWFRAVIVDILGKNQFKVLLIDYGNNIIINKNKLINLRELSPMLAKFPRQAYKVQLFNIRKTDFNEKLINRLIELAPLTEKLLCKIIKIHKNQLPLVELFKRIQPNNVLISINNTLVLGPKIDNIDDDIGNNNVKPKKSITLKYDDNTIDTFKQPKLPNIGKKFTIRMCNLIATPSNFIVQIDENFELLTVMMSQLKNSCNNEPISLPHDTIRKGKLCAAKRDNEWYRASINGFIDALIVVYLCDYGEMIFVPIDELQVLKKQFLQLPYQALKAKLHGVEPINGDWSPLTCKRYQELVSNKKFTSIIRKVEKDETFPTKMKLSLELIDSFDKSVKIHEILVNEKRAVYNEA